MDFCFITLSFNVLQTLKQINQLINILIDFCFIFNICILFIYVCIYISNLININSFDSSYKKFCLFKRKKKYK